MFKVLFYQPTFNLLIVLYNLLGANLGWAIIAVAALSRLITFPITKTQIKTAQKSKDFQKKYEAIKKKYKKNKQKLNEELAKLQAQYLPGQLASCLPMIILIILLIQIRGGVVNLVSKGWYAFNEVSYFESLKKEEDSIKFTPEEELSIGEHALKISVTASNGNSLEKEYKFEIVEDKEVRKEEIIKAESEKSQEEKDEEFEAEQKVVKNERATDISVYSGVAAESEVRVPLSKFLIFVTKTRSVYLLEEKKPGIEIYLRPPSNEVIVSDEAKVFLDDIEITAECEITQGESLNLKFLGIDLSKVAADFSWSDSRIIPYVVLAFLVGGAQFATTQMLSGLRTFGGKKKQPQELQKKGKKKEEEEMPDMTEVMTMANKQMMFMLPLLTVVTSLGYWGGANIFPSGISIFWTVQSLFVIIQQFLMNREKVLKWIRSKVQRHSGEADKK